MSGDGATESLGVIVFRLCGQIFGLPVGSVREVVPIVWLETPPRMPAMVRGILNLGGRAVPILRLDRLLGLGDGCYGLDASILIMRGGEAQATLGLLVEHVDGVRADEDFTSLGLQSGQSFNDCLSDQLDRAGQRLSLLSWRHILLAEERVRLAEFQAEAQARLAGFDGAMR